MKEGGEEDGDGWKGAGRNGMRWHWGTVKMEVKLMFSNEFITVKLFFLNVKSRWTCCSSVSPKQNSQLSLKWKLKHSIPEIEADE